MLKKYKMHVFAAAAITIGISIYGAITISTIDVSGDSKEILSKITSDLKTKCEQDGQFNPVHTKFKTETGMFGLNINSNISDIKIMLLNGTVISTHTFKCIGRRIIAG